MRVLVTGGAGFIGSNLVDLLIDEGYDVKILDDLSSGSLDFINPKAEFINGNICDQSLTNKVCKNIDYVFHLAAIASIPISIRHPEKCIEVNELGTIKVYMIGIKPSVDRLYLDEEERVFNSSISFLAKEDPYLEYINVWDLMLNEDGTRMPDLYVEDGLHMNPKGYEIWTQLVRESLNKDFNL